VRFRVHRPSGDKTGDKPGDEAGDEPAYPVFAPAGDAT